MWRKQLHDDVLTNYHLLLLGMLDSGSHFSFFLYLPTDLYPLNFGGALDYASTWHFQVLAELTKQCSASRKIHVLMVKIDSTVSKEQL